MHVDQGVRTYLSEYRERTGTGSSEALIAALMAWYEAPLWKRLNPVTRTRMRREVQSAFVLYDMFEGELQ